MPVFEILLEDHRQLFKIMENIAAIISVFSFKGKNQELEELFDIFCKQFSDHHFVEDKIFYPSITLFPYLKYRLLKAQQAHDIIQNNLSQLEMLTKDNVSWGARFMVIRDLMHLHLNEEENEIFPVANDLLIPPVKEALAEKIQRHRTSFESQSLI